MNKMQIEKILKELSRLKRMGSDKDGY